MLMTDSGYFKGWKGVIELSNQRMPRIWKAGSEAIAQQDIHFKGTHSVRLSLEIKSQFRRMLNAET